SDLPRAFLLHCEPQDRPSNGLRSLPLVVSQRLLVARVLLPLPLLAADLGGVLPALHDCVPLCSGPDGVGNSLVDDVLQCHTSLTSGRPGTSWHRSGTSGMGCICSAIVPPHLPQSQRQALTPLPQSIPSATWVASGVYQPEIG